MIMAILDNVKTALRVTTNAFDTNELNLLIDSAKADLGIAGIEIPTELDAICSVAIITYCKMHFGTVDPNEYDRLERSYNEQKAQLQMATGYGL